MSNVSLIDGHIDNAEHCVCCGQVIPEGRQVCIICGKKVDTKVKADMVEVVRCKDCIHAIELDKHCDINRTAYKHCTLLRGDETKYVWHKYKKYYKDYSIVEPNDFCSCGIKRGEDNAKEKE